MLDRPFTMPTFKGNQRRFAYFRTRLSQAAQEGVNFGGRYNIALIGCGLQCLRYYLIDGTSGIVSSFLFHSEDYPELVLSFRIDSLLVKAMWTNYDFDHPLCFYADVVVREGEYVLLSRERFDGECPE